MRLSTFIHLGLPECSARYNRDTLPMAEQSRMRGERERIGRHFAIFAIGAVLAAFGSAWL
jgi:hypothetical protein